MHSCTAAAVDPLSFNNTVVTASIFVGIFRALRSKHSRQNSNYTWYGLAGTHGHLRGAEDGGQLVVVLV